MHLSQLESAAVWKSEETLADESMPLEPTTPVCVCITNFFGFFILCVWFIGL